MLSFYLSLDSALIQYLFIFSLLAMLYVIFSCDMMLVRHFLNVHHIGGPIDERPVKPRQIASEISGGLANSAVVAAYFYVAFLFVDHDDPVSIGVGLVQAFGFIIVYDFYFYWTHRLLHESRLSKYHVQHHRSVISTPWACLNLHPVEGLIIFLPYLIFAIVFPESLTVILGIYTYLLFVSAWGHSNYNLLGNSKRWLFLQDLICFHQYHHSSGSANYGYAYTHWDSVFGTKHAGPPAVIEEIKSPVVQTE